MTTVSDLLDLVVRDYRLKRRKSIGVLTCHLQPLRRSFGSLPAAELDWNRIEAYKEERIGLGRAPKTVNNELGYLRRAYEIGRKAGLVESAPVIERLPGERVRTGYLEPEEFWRFHARLPDPIDELTAWAYLTGWRRRECLSLEWSWVAGDRVILPGERSKNGDARTVSAPSDSLLGGILERRRKRRRGLLVFHRDGKPIKTFLGPWKAAAEAIGRPDLLFHDLRRSAARNLINAGVPEVTAQAYLGHRTTSVFRRYAIRSDSDLCQARRKLEDYLNPPGANTDLPT